MSGGRFNYENLMCVAVKDVDVLEMKDKEYGSSWKKRGGVGAFMMLARKWDRIENFAAAAQYDVIGAAVKESREDGVLDDIADLRRYLLLVEEEVRHQLGQFTST